MDVLILGCGYVGRELGQQLLDAGHAVTGVVRTESSVAAIQASRIQAVQADLTDTAAVRSLPDTDALVFAASAGRGSVADARTLYIDGLQSVVSTFEDRENSPDRLLFTSSTGVYGDQDGEWVDKSTSVDPSRPKARVIAEAEAVVHRAAMASTVARFAGLYGPARYRIESSLDSATAGWRNSVHRDDAAGALAWFLTEDVAREETVLVSDGTPVDRWSFADWLAEQCGEPEPEKLTVEARRERDGLPASATTRLTSQKRCRNDRLLELGYEPTYSSVYEGYKPAIDAYRDDENV